MLNKLQAFIWERDMLRPGDRVICAVSGGADSMALLWAMYLLRDKLRITVEAAHFDHGLRGQESRRDADFVRQFCEDYRIPFHLGRGKVVPGPKGVEAAAREARYTFLESLPGKIATAHTADDNAETLLMHLIRGTGLKGLGGIHPIRGNVIRPMLTVDRDMVMDFLESYSIPHIHDSTNDQDHFLRNRLRHRVMPLLKEENPQLMGSLSQTALMLRQDEEALTALTPDTNRVSVLRTLSPSQRSRALYRLLTQWGLGDIRQEYVALMEQLVLSEKPSGKISLGCGLSVARDYDVLKPAEPALSIPEQILSVPGEVELAESGILVRAVPAREKRLTTDCFTVHVQGDLILRSRRAGDHMRLHGGTVTLKKLFIDRKISASSRSLVPVLSDGRGVVGVYGVGANMDRTDGPGDLVQIQFIKTEKESEA